MTRVGAVGTFTPVAAVAGVVEFAIDGVAQSHLDPGDPTVLIDDYVRRMAAVLDAVAPAGRPVRVLHLGAGALTLARYLQHTRPGSEQSVVEIEEGLVAEVVGRMPLPAGTRLRAVTGDAADVVRETAASGPSADVVIADLYQGITTPPHLITPAFYAAVARLLDPAGVLLVNVADDDGHPALDAHRHALATAFPHRLLLAPADVLADERAGNVVIVAGAESTLAALAPALRAAGPHPAAVRRDPDPMTAPGSPTTPTPTTTTREDGAPCAADSL